MPITRENLDDVFTYHAPDEQDRINYGILRSKAKELAHAMLICCPPCADQQAAIRKVREAVMTANAAIATKGAV
jgi:hypothetical protein